MRPNRMDILCELYDKKEEMETKGQTEDLEYHRLTGEIKGLRSSLNREFKKNKPG